MMVKLLYGLFLSAVAFEIALGTACPFNLDSCTCTDDPAGLYDFDEAFCESHDVLPHLSDRGGTYTVRTLTIISNETYMLPGRYFAAFSSIDYLRLGQWSLDDHPIGQSFNDHVFDGVKIDSVIFDGLTGLVPPPASLSHLGKSGLLSLSIARHGPLDLIDSTFNDFPSLTTISIAQTPIVNIGNAAFALLRYKLNKLELRDAGLTDLPSELDPRSTTIPMKLTKLDLSGNNITYLPRDSFEPYASLRTLDLSDNPIAHSIDKGALNGLTNNTQSLRLANVGLTSMLVFLFNTGGYPVMDLSRNEIGCLQQYDLVSATNVESLILDENPLEMIEAGVFPDVPLSQFKSISLKNTRMTQIDLTLLIEAGANLTHLYLDDIAVLDDVGASAVAGAAIPQHLFIHLTHTSLKHLNSTVEQILGSSPNVRLDISGCSHLICEGIEWISPYLFDTEQVIAHDTLCADQGGATLQEYLRGARTSTAAPRDSD